MNYSGNSKAGDIVYVLDMADTDWWKARVKGKEGQVRWNRVAQINQSFHNYSSQVPSNYLEAAAHDGSTSPLHDAAKRGEKELIIAIVIVSVVIFLSL